MISDATLNSAPPPYPLPPPNCESPPRPPTNYFLTPPSPCSADAAKRSPELIQLLELHMQFSTITPYGKSAEPGHMIEKPLTKRDSGIQTETHPIESNIDPTYEWNEWEMRRKAIKLANLRTRMTHSVQTDNSNFRRQTSTQIYLPKDSETQTKRDQGTSVPKPSIFIAGLRGCKTTTTKAYKVDLTLDVNTHNDICD
eukprot:sb/3470743/